MSYIKAEDILPRELLEEIQRYVDGQCLYIPRKPGSRRAWGMDTDYKAELRRRNRGIREDHAGGLSVEELREKYHLSEKSIRRILRER